MRPQIAMRKEDGRTYWALTHQPAKDGCTFELQVRYDMLATGTRLFRFDEGERKELLDSAAFAERVKGLCEHEPVECANCAGLSDEERAQREDIGGPCGDCRAASREAAAEWLHQNDIEVASFPELEVGAGLRKHWDAFALLFNPAVTM